MTIFFSLFTPNVGDFVSLFHNASTYLYDEIQCSPLQVIVCAASLFALHNGIYYRKMDVSINEC